MSPAHGILAWHCLKKDNAHHLNNAKSAELRKKGWGGRFGFCLKQIAVSEPFICILVAASKWHY